MDEIQAVLDGDLLRISSVVSEEELITLHCHHADHRADIPISREATVQNLKTAFRASAHSGGVILPSAQITLRIGGIELIDEDTLAQNQVEDGATITVEAGTTMTVIKSAAAQHHGEIEIRPAETDPDGVVTLISDKAQRFSACAFEPVSQRLVWKVRFNVSEGSAVDETISAGFGITTNLDTLDVNPITDQPGELHDLTDLLIVRL